MPYLQQIAVRYEYPVYFTRDLFAPANRSLIEAISGREPGRRHRLFFVVDRGVADAFPALIEEIHLFARSHREELDLVAQPRVIAGGEACKNDLALVMALQEELASLTPDFHGWPDRFGFLDSTQAVFNPQKGPGDDLCSPPQPPFPACDPAFKQKTSPVRHVLDHFPQPPIAPLAIEPADVAVVGPDFAPDSFTNHVVREGAALIAREGDFGFSPANGKPNEGHDIQLVNFGKKRDPLELSLLRFAFNCKKANQGHNPDGSPKCTNRVTGEDLTEDHAFVAMIHGINRPIQVQFGPDRALYLVDYGAVRDFGQSNPKSKFIGPTDGPLVQIPETGVIWKIERTEAAVDRDNN